MWVWFFFPTRSDRTTLGLLKGSLKKDAVSVTVFYFILVASVISNTLSNGRWSFKSLSQGNSFLQIQTGTAQEPGLQACWPAGAPFPQGIVSILGTCFPTQQLSREVSEWLKSKVPSSSSLRFRTCPGGTVEYKCSIHLMKEQGQRTSGSLR